MSQVLELPTHTHPKQTHTDRPSAYSETFDICRDHLLLGSQINVSTAAQQTYKEEQQQYVVSLENADVALKCYQNLYQD